MMWVCPKCGVENNDELTTQCLCRSDQAIHPTDPKTGEKGNPNEHDKRVIFWTWIVFGAYVLSSAIGFTFTIGQDGPGAGMGFGFGLVIGYTFLCLPASFRLAYLLRSIPTKITKKKKIRGRIAVAFSMVMLLPMFAVLLAEGFYGCALLGSAVAYVGFFGLSRPHMY